MIVFLLATIYFYQMFELRYIFPIIIRRFEDHSEVYIPSDTRKFIHYQYKSVDCNNWTIIIITLFGINLYNRLTMRSKELSEVETFNSKSFARVP